jgi:DNA-binding Lrp family transcriptional regulator
MEESGLIAGYVMLLDPAAVGVTGVAYVSVTLDQQGRATLDRFESEVRRHPEIVECYLLAGLADYMLRIAYRDALDFERIHTDIITQLPGVSRVQSTLALRTVKRTTALPLGAAFLRHQVVKTAHKTAQADGIAFPSENARVSRYLPCRRMLPP